MLIFKRKVHISIDYKIKITFAALEIIAKIVFYREEEKEAFRSMIARLASDINSLFDLIATLRAGVAAQTDSFPSRYVCNSRFYSTKELHHSTPT